MTTAVHAMTIGLKPGEEPREWYASCGPCNWYGDYYDRSRDAVLSARRHRRTHKVTT